MWHNLEDEALKAWAQKHPQGAIIIDIREPGEHAAEAIEGSINLPLSALDQMDWSPYSDREVLIYCQRGQRTLMNRERLHAKGLKHIMCVGGGLLHWKACGLPTRKGGGSTMRCVQGMVGVMLWACVAWGVLVNPMWGLAGAGVIGLGLIVAGLTGFCGMERLLKRCGC